MLLLSNLVHIPLKSRIYCCKFLILLYRQEVYVQKVSLIWTFPSEPKHTNSHFNHCTSYAAEVFSICWAHVAAAFPRSDNGSGLPGSVTHDGPSHRADLFGIQRLQSSHHTFPVWEQQQQQQHASLVNEKRWLWRQRLFIDGVWSEQGRWDRGGRGGQDVTRMGILSKNKPSCKQQKPTMVWQIPGCLRFTRPLYKHRRFSALWSNPSRTVWSFGSDHRNLNIAATSSLHMCRPTDEKALHNPHSLGLGLDLWTVFPGEQTQTIKPKTQERKQHTSPAHPSSLPTGAIFSGKHVL